MSDGRVGASFRDPSGFVFELNGELFRQVNHSYASDWERLNSSGLGEELTRSGYLISHETLGTEGIRTPDGMLVIRPTRVPLVSYPYEWCFSQLKGAALATLEIQERALAKGMSLKDANAQNIQFLEGRPVLIDTLSFETYREGQPWVAYRQFCQHFVAPLVLMAYADVRLGKLAELYADGIPLDLASSLAPRGTHFKVWIKTHLHLHAKAQAAGSGTDKAPKVAPRGMPLTSLRGLIDSLKSLVGSLDWKPQGTVWADYYDNTNYSTDSMSAKRALVAEFTDSIGAKPITAWDLGANTGEFSRVLTERGIPTVAWDVDPAAVERAYRRVKSSGEKLLLPLLQDLTMPSPASGWANRERKAFSERGPAGLILALALVHHLAIGNNVPLADVADLFAGLAPWAIVEFVPKEDSQVQRMLSAREDVFPTYTKEGFEAAFSGRYTIERQAGIPGTVRTLYLLKRLGS